LESLSLLSKVFNEKYLSPNPKLTGILDKETLKPIYINHILEPVRELPPESPNIGGLCEALNFLVPPNLGVRRRKSLL
jgi:hypothetical protein